MDTVAIVLHEICTRDDILVWHMTMILIGMSDTGPGNFVCSEGCRDINSWNKNQHNQMNQGDNGVHHASFQDQNMDL